MAAALTILLAVLSIWDYPLRYPRHDTLRRQFVVALRAGDTATMEETCRKGVELLPDDPTWHYNLACSLAYFPKRTDEAFGELELAIDLGFRDVEAIRKDTDLKRLEKLPRYKELIEYADFMRARPMLSGPLSAVNATGIFGDSIALGEQNFGWNFDVGCFKAKMKLAVGAVRGNTGDLYMNRDGGHSPSGGPAAMQRFLAEFPGLTEVKVDAAARALPPGKRPDMSYPNMLFPYPVFGNCSMAIVHPKNWRSLPRALTTIDVRHLPAMQKLYLSNQIWVFPSNYDTPPVGTNGDVFAAITPYWLTSAGRSYSDIPLLRAALTASRALQRPVKAEIVKRGLLAPTIMTLMRKSMGVVTSEDDYTSPRAHPTAIAVNAVNTNRLSQMAAKLTVAEIPPLAVISVKPDPLKEPSVQPELVYRTGFAWSFVLRTKEPRRTFTISAKGAKEFRFVQTHGTGVRAAIEQVDAATVRVTFPIDALKPTNRLDIAVFGRNPGTGWGAPSYVSFARMDASAPYSDPVLTILPVLPTPETK